MPDTSRGEGSDHGGADRLPRAKSRHDGKGVPPHLKPEMTVDVSEWTRAARALHEASSRTSVDFINGQALKVAIEAVRRTEKADASRIERELGAAAREGPFYRQTTRGKNKGQWRRFSGGSVLKADSLASRILGWRMKNRGRFGVDGDTDDERARNLIAIRKRSRSFIASGWIGARNALFSLVKQKDPKTRSIADAKQYGQPKGSATPARFTLRSVMQAIIGNTALLSQSREPSKARDPRRTATKGLQAALNEAARDMTAELARRLQPDFKKVSAK